MTFTTTPMRDGSCNASDLANNRRTCLMCTRPPASARARYCSPACRQRSFRLRRVQAEAIDDRRLRAELRRRGALVAHTVYECSDCGERFVGERRCSSCNRFCRALGLGGRCSECDEPLLLADLLELEADQ
jgi:hypothetical protein